MKSVTLAAGLGSRLRPLTNEKPKCMVEFLDVPIIERQINKLREFQITDNYVITGYRRDKINLLNASEIYNDNYSSTNMVYSLALARHLLDGSSPLLVSYGDIIYNSKTLTKLLSVDVNTFGVVSDLNWEKYWQKRSEDYLSDVESFSVDSEGCITSVGQAWISKSDICGQYIGLFVIPASMHTIVKTYLEEVFISPALHNMYMTDFLQMIIDKGHCLRPIYIKSGWLEFDCISDLNPSFSTFFNA